MLTDLFATDMQLGAAQAVVTTLLALGVVLLAKRQNIRIGKETTIALGRGIIQVLVMGSVLFLLLEQPLWAAIPVLLAMQLAAASIGARRSKSIPGAWWVCARGIGLGSGVLIITMTFVGVIDWEMGAVIPVGSMIINSAMNAVALGLDRFQGEVESHAGEIDAALALGADPRVAVRRHVQAATEAALIPQINSLRSLGVVWLPGLMTGMILAGTDPIYAALYQFVVLAMLFAGSGLSALVSMLLVRTQVFSPAMQLILRPGLTETGSVSDGDR